VRPVHSVRELQPRPYRDPCEEDRPR
jgi:hypothetical protein